MKKLLAIVVLGLLWSGSAKADHYKTGIMFGDPYVIGCIYDLLDASFGSKCAQRSIKFYFNERKHRGSYDRAYNNCYSYLRELGYRKYNNFNNETYQISCSD